jgi:hypothetical protein
MHTLCKLLQTIYRHDADNHTSVHLVIFSHCAVVFAGPVWRQSDRSVLVASRRFNRSRSRKTKGSLANTLQCNIWRRAQKPHRMTHSLHGGQNQGRNNGFAALGKSIGTRKSTDKDLAYVVEHPVLKYLLPKLANFLNDFRRPNWFPRFGLPVSNGRHNQLRLRKSSLAADEARGAACGFPRWRKRSRPARDSTSFKSSAASTSDTRTSTASSLSTAGRSRPTTSWCECARFAVGM